MSSLLRDLRLAWRQLKKRPVYSLSIVAVFAVGIGANTAMYSAFEAWVLRPLDFDDPQELVTVYESQPLQGRARVSVSPKTLGDWREAQTAFSDVAAFRRVFVNLSDTEDPVRVDATRIEAGLFPLLGRRPVLGRSFSEAEDLPGRPAALAMISDDLWRERYAADPEILGRRVRVDGLAHEIIGVMPPGFAFPEWADVWLPLGLDVQAGERTDRSLSVVARLAEGVSVDAADDAMGVLATELGKRHPETHRDWSAEVLPLREEWAPPVIEVAMTASLGATLLVLLVICANVGSLVLAQAASRQQETAIRTALGASQTRLAQQSVVEIGLLALLAGLLGMVLAKFGVDAMLSAVPVSPPYLFTMSFSPLAALYTLVVALLAGAVCGWAPLARRGSSFEALKSGGRAGRRRATARARSFLVAGELALTTALLIGALLMVKSYVVQQATTDGFDPDGVVSTELALSGTGLETVEERRRVALDLLASVEAGGGVEVAGLATATPASQAALWEVVPIGSSEEQSDTVTTNVHAVTSGYLEALTLRTLRGRTFTPLEDREGGAVVLVSESLSERLWPGQDAIGRQLRSAVGESPWLTVVGLVADVDVAQDMVDFGGTTHGQAYVPWSTRASAATYVVVRSPRPAEEAVAELREIVKASLPGVPVTEVLTMQESLERVGWVSLFFARQLGQYAGLGLLISLVGLYGLMSDSVRQRDRELATRAAFGARQVDLVSMVLGQAAKLILTGIGAGLLLAVATVRFGSGLLVGVDVFDPTVYSTVVVLLLLVAVVAVVVPAVRAVRRSPIAALRGD